MAHTNILERAKKGDTVAIETILNDALRDYNVSVKVGLKQNCLYVVLASAQVPQQVKVIEVIRQQISELCIDSVENAKIYAAVWGQEGQAWHDEFNLGDRQPNQLTNQPINNSDIPNIPLTKQAGLGSDDVTTPSPIEASTNPDDSQESQKVPIISTEVSAQVHDNYANSDQASDQVASIWDDDIQLDEFLQIGSHLLKLDVSHGLSVETNPHFEPVKFQPRSTPIRSSPPALLYLIGRIDEVNRGIVELNAGKSLEFYSGSGLGKSAIIQHLSHCLDHNLVGKDGIWSFHARHQTADDILQAVFNGFYETKLNYKPTSQEIADALAIKDALIVIDDNHLSDSSIAHLQQKLPQSQLLLASPNQRLQGDSISIQLLGLSLSDARTLFTQELQRNLSHDEVDALEKLVQRSPEFGKVENPTATPEQHHLTISPWLLKLAAWLVKECNYSLETLCAKLPQQRPDIELVKVFLAQLTPPEYTVIEVLAAMGGVVMLAPQISALSGITQAEEILARLVSSHIVQIEGDRYRVHDCFVEIFNHLNDATSQDQQRSAQIRQRALNYFSSWAKRYVSLPSLVISEADAIMEMLAWGVRTQKWQSVLNTATAFEPTLIRTKLWGLWGIVLDYIHQAARQLDDQKTCGWVLHQQGTRLLCLGENLAAQEYLERALQIRQTLQDAPGINVTRVNLNQISVLEQKNVISTPNPVPQTSPTPTPQFIRSKHNPYLSLRVWLLRSVFLGISGLIGYLAWSMLTRLDPVKDTTSLAPKPISTPKNQASPTPQVSFSQQKIDFGTFVMDGEQPQQTLTITNHSSSSLRINELEKIGENSDFDLKLAPCSSIIAPRERCSISVIFAPLDAGKHNAKIQITDSNNNPIQTIVILGVAKKPAPSQEYSSPPPLTIMIDEPLPLPKNKQIPTNRIQIPQPRSPVIFTPNNTTPVFPDPSTTPETAETLEPTPIETPETPANSESTPFQVPPFIAPTPESPSSTLPIPTVTPENTPSPIFSMESEQIIPNTNQQQQ